MCFRRYLICRGDNQSFLDGCTSGDTLNPSLKVQIEILENLSQMALISYLEMGQTRDIDTGSLVDSHPEEDQIKSNLDQFLKSKKRRTKTRPLYQRWSIFLCPHLLSTRGHRLWIDGFQALRRGGGSPWCSGQHRIGWEKVNQRSMKSNVRRGITRAHIFSGAAWRKWFACPCMGPIPPWAKNNHCNSSL